MPLPSLDAMVIWAILNNGMQQRVDPVPAPVPAPVIDPVPQPSPNPPLRPRDRRRRNAQPPAPTRTAFSLTVKYGPSITRSIPLISAVFPTIEILPSWTTEDIIADFQRTLRFNVVLYVVVCNPGHPGGLGATTSLLRDVSVSKIYEWLNNRKDVSLWCDRA